MNVSVQGVIIGNSAVVLVVLNSGALTFLYGTSHEARPHPRPAVIGPVRSLPVEIAVNEWSRGFFNKVNRRGWPGLSAVETPTHLIYNSTCCNSVWPRDIKIPTFYVLKVTV